MNLYARSLLILAVTVTKIYGAIYDRVSQLPTRTYDYIVIGGGTAGSVIANRLTEDSDIQVLVLEAGGSHEGILASAIPLLSPTLSPSTPYDWNYTTSPQPGLNGRSIYYPRGKVLGGSSTTNYMVYNTGSRDDWDHINRITEDPCWAWDAMAPYRDLNQKYVAPNDGHDDTNQYLPSAHSRNGMVSISLPGFTWPTDSRVVAATAEPAFASDFPFQRDMNTGNTIGFGWVQATIANGQRSSSATTYVGPDYVNRPNLHILLHAHATKLLEVADLHTPAGSTYVHLLAAFLRILRYPQALHAPIFNGVEFGIGSSSKRWQVTACKEVILSAGVFNTPQLLMLSGIGDPAELTSLGIPARVNLPSVGKNMSDHVLLGNPWRVHSNETFDTHLAPDVLPQRIQEWNRTHRGPLSWTLTSQMAWMRLPPNDTIIQTHGDPSPGPTSAHYQFIWTNGWVVPGFPEPEGSWMTTHTNLISPTSRGTVKLRSLNPFDPPIVDPDLLSTDFDIKTMVAAVKHAKRLVTAKAWKGFVSTPWEPLASANTDEEIARYIRDHSSVVFHAVGTAGISQRGAPWGVLDPDLKVKGTTGLRVVDASAIPYVPTAHTQGPVYLLAEVAAGKIKGGH